MELDDSAGQSLAGRDEPCRDTRRAATFAETMRQAVGEFVEFKTSAGHWRPATAYGSRKILDEFARDFPDVGDVEPQRLARWIGARGAAANYRRRRWSVTKGFLDWLGHPVPVDAPKVPRAVPRPLREVDVRALLDVCDERDEVIVSLGICEGLRRGEMAVLEMSDLDFDGEVLFVHGKGGKQRWVPLTKATRVRIERYLDGERGYASGPLLVSRRNGASLEPATVTRIVSRALKRAGINRPGANLHSLRHTAATRLWMETSDLFMTQQLLGHSSIRTTAMYVKARPTAAMKDAMDRCST